MASVEALAAMLATTFEVGSEGMGLGRFLEDGRSAGQLAVLLDEQRRVEPLQRVALGRAHEVDGAMGQRLAAGAGLDDTRCAQVR